MANGGNTQQSSSSGSGDWAGAITSLITAPTGGGGWDTDWYSTQSPEQRAFFQSLLNAARDDRQAVRSNYDPESLSLFGLNQVRTEEALQYYRDAINEGTSRETIDANTAAARAAADEAIAGLNISYGGKGSRSSAANRAKGRVASDLGTNISQIYAQALKEATAQKIAAAGGFANAAGGLESRQLQGLITREQLLGQQSMQNAAMQNQMTQAQMQYLMGLATAQTGENIATQQPYTSLWGDAVSAIGDAWHSIF